MSWSNKISSYASQVRSKISQGVNTAKKEVNYYAQKTANGVKSGTKDIVKSYGADDAVNTIANYKASGYNHLVEKGIAVATPASKFLTKKAIPVANVYFAGKDLVTFGKGFARGWQAYGR